jgi:hypothetical protein
MHRKLAERKVEEKDGCLVLVDEEGKEVYSVEASKGTFIELP